MHRIPISADIAHSALWEACSPGAAEATYWEYATSLSPDDICYMVLSTDRATTLAVAHGWGGTAKNLWFIGPDQDPEIRLWNLESLRGTPRSAWMVPALVYMSQQTGIGHCKWWYTGSDTTWVNPRAILRAVRGLPHDTIPSFQGFMWMDQGFTDEVTATNGGTALWSRAAWDALIPALSSTSTPPRCPTEQTEDGKPLPSGELVVAQCAEICGILPFDFHVYDGTGAIQRNGVPLEPGPPHGERLDWLAQAPTRAGHWAWIDGMNAGWQESIWAQHSGMYGVWGKLGERNWLDGEDDNFRSTPSVTPRQHTYPPP